MGKPKSKAEASRPGEPVKQAVKQARKNAATSAPASHLSAAKAAEDREGPTRVVFRLNTDAQVVRGIRATLGLHPRQQAAQNTNTYGDTIADVVPHAAARLRSTRKYLGLQFWRNIVVGFNLTGSLAELLTPPDTA